MLGVITTILTVILVFICLLMSLVILMQRPKQEGLGAAFGGGIADKMLGSGTTDFLQRATVMMGVAFFVLSLTIATLMAYDRDADRKAGVGAVKEAEAANADPTEPEAPEAPANANALEGGAVGAAAGGAAPAIEPPAADVAPAIEAPAGDVVPEPTEIEVPELEVEAPAEGDAAAPEGETPEEK